ncbi:MAG: hypothetical protein ACYC49_18835 [Ignavibacteriaceae bacterium]
MKKLILFTLFPFLLFAQITTTNVAPQSETPTINFDSTKNFQGENVYAYLNQELYLPCKSDILRKYGWDYFDDNFPTQSIKVHYDYEKLADKYYFVTKIDKANYGYGDYIFTLKEKDSGQIFYFQYSTILKGNYEFIAMPYFNYLRKEYIDKEYIVRGKTFKDGPATDINTGKIIDFSNGTHWKCVDITLEPEFYSLCVKLKNEKNEFILMPVTNISRPDWAISKEKADYLKQNYGDELWNIALDKKVKIGMTEELCEIAWGKPWKINRTNVSNSVHEQWVYGEGSNYLYFEDGVLTAIQ